MTSRRSLRDGPQEGDGAMAKLIWIQSVLLLSTEATHQREHVCVTPATDPDLNPRHSQSPPPTINARKAV